MTRYRLYTPPIVGPGKVTEELTRLLQHARRMTTSLVVVGQPYKRVPMRAVVLDVPDLFADTASRVLEVILGPSGRFERQQGIAEREEWEHATLLTPAVGTQPLDESVFDGWSSACLHLHWIATKHGNSCLGVLFYCSEDTERVAGLSGRGWKVATFPKVALQLRKGAAQLVSQITQSDVGHGPYIGRVVVAVAPPIVNTLLAPAAERMESIFAGDAPPVPAARRTVGTVLAVPGADGFRLGVSPAGIAVNLALNALTLAVDASAEAQRDLMLALLARALGSGMGVAAVVPPQLVAGNTLSGVELRLRKLDPRDIAPSSAIPWAQIEPSLLLDAFRAAGLAVDALPAQLPAQLGELLSALPGGDVWCTAPLLMLTANPGDDLRGVVRAVGATVLVDVGSDSTMLGNLLFALLASPPLQRPLLIIRPPHLTVPSQLASQAIQIVLGEAPDALGILRRTPSGWLLTHTSGAPTTELDADLQREPASLDESAHQMLLDTLGGDGAFGSWAGEPQIADEDGLESAADDWLRDDVFAAPPSRPPAPAPQRASVSAVPTVPWDSGLPMFAPSTPPGTPFLGESEPILVEEDGEFPIAPALVDAASAVMTTPQIDAWMSPAAVGADGGADDYAPDVALAAVPGAWDDFADLFAQPLDTPPLYAPQMAPDAVFLPADDSERESPSVSSLADVDEADMLGDQFVWASMSLGSGVPVAPFADQVEEAPSNAASWFDAAAFGLESGETFVQPDDLLTAPLAACSPEGDLAQESFPALDQGVAPADELWPAPVNQNRVDDQGGPAYADPDHLVALAPSSGSQSALPGGSEVPLDLFAVPPVPIQPGAQDWDDLTTVGSGLPGSDTGSIWDLLNTIPIPEEPQPDAPADAVLVEVPLVSEIDTVEAEPIGAQQAAESTDTLATSDPVGSAHMVRSFRSARRRFAARAKHPYRLARQGSSGAGIAREDTAPGDPDTRRADTLAELTAATTGAPAVAMISHPELIAPLVMPDLAREVLVADLALSVMAPAPAPPPSAPLGTLAGVELLTAVSTDYELAGPVVDVVSSEQDAVQTPAAPVVAGLLSLVEETAMPEGASARPDGLVIDEDAVWVGWQAGRGLSTLVRELCERNPAADVAEVRRAIRKIVERHTTSWDLTAPAAAEATPAVATTLEPPIVGAAALGSVQEEMQQLDAVAPPISTIPDVAPAPETDETMVLPTSPSAALVPLVGDSDEAIWSCWQAGQDIDEIVRALCGFSDGIKATQTRNHIYAVAAARLVEVHQAGDLADRLLNRRAPLQRQREQYDKLLRGFARRERLPAGQPRQQLESRLLNALRMARMSAAA